MRAEDINLIAYERIAWMINDIMFDDHTDDKEIETVLREICGIVYMAEQMTTKLLTEPLKMAIGKVQKAKKEIEETLPLPSEEEQEAIEEAIKGLMEEKQNSTPKKPRAPKADFTGAHKMPKDLDKLRACIEAGKDIKWCMTEWSVCEQTIRNWMAEAGIKKKDGRRKDK